MQASRTNYSLSKHFPRAHYIKALLIARNTFKKLPVEQGQGKEVNMQLQHSVIDGMKR